ncbi:hypothetical protein DY703_23795 [Salmonella enterica]|nr:hypothetical protein [Salmonella enterica]EBQ9480292.1 hypothetical protein [Salmonella enterica subsp. enterica serovar Kokomlemle]EBU8701204.1 hypothetical protein [Salmonella enterica subsp. enterica serovar Kokomlemle]ECX4748545.1 Bro-N domain-containing protein [Salmonella enterica]
MLWFASKDIASALGYAKTNAITHIYNVNADEFSAGMTEVVETTTSGNLRMRSRVFSLRGTHLIAMLAKTPLAKEFRKWILDLLDDEAAAFKEAYIAEFDRMENELHQNNTPPHDKIIQGDGRTLVIRFDEHGNIKFTETVPENACVCTLENFKFFLEQQGWTLINRNKIKSMTVEQLLSLK